MSNLLLEGSSDQLFVTEEQTSYLADNLAPGILQLSGCTIADILDGNQPISSDTVFYSPNGKQLKIANFLITELRLSNVKS